jgi:hypothetical protein
LTLFIPNRATESALCDVAWERKSQDEKWGEQNHPNGTGVPSMIAAAINARLVTDAHARRGKVTWADILREEFAEALAEEDPQRLRAELVQVAAVAVAWIESLDRES